MKRISVAVWYTLILFVFISCTEAPSGTGNDVELEDPLTITSVEPDSGSAGTQIKISGSGFKLTPSLNEVFFNGVPAPVDSSTAINLFVKVPFGASTGPIKVEVGNQSIESAAFNVLKGTLKVIIGTSGDDQDRDGYVANLEAVEEIDAAINDTLVFDRLDFNSYEFQLNDLDNACAAEGDNPIVADIASQDTTEIIFSIICEEVVLLNQIIYEKGSDFYLMNSDGSNDRLFMRPPGGRFALITSPKISRDGKSVVFDGRISVSEDPVSESDNGEIYMADASGWPTKAITNTVNPILSFEPMLSANNDRIVFTQQGIRANDGFLEVSVINIDGSAHRNVTDFAANDRRPSWSPDGTQIAFSSDRDMGRSSIFLMDADGTNIRQLTDNSEFDSYPSWSPDGTKIVFVSARSGIPEKLSLYMINADGSNMTELTGEGSNDRSPSWSPDGRQIVFNRWMDLEQWEIMVINADGSGLTNLTNTPFTNEFSPYWSPIK